MSETRKAIYLDLCASFFFSLMGFLSQSVARIPVFQKTLVRSIVTFTILAVSATVRKEKVVIEKRNLPLYLTRSIFGIVGIIGYLYSADHLVFSDASMIQKLAPFFSITISLFLLKEKASANQWALVAIDMTGLVFVVKPAGALGVGIAEIVVVIGAVGSGAAYVLVRKLGINGASPTSIVLFFSGFTVIACIPIIISSYVRMTAAELILLIGMGVCGGTAQILITIAYGKAPAKEISIVEYSEIVFAALLGFIFDHELADKTSMIGYLIIFAAALLRIKTS